MTETIPNNGAIVAADATFNSNSQLLTLQYGTTDSFYESRTYNSLLQLTHLVNAHVDMQYLYNTGHNNGRVAQTIDGILNETVNYTYDNLHRLISAVATNNSWGESYSFDGFGNLNGKTPTVGSAPAYGGGGGNSSNGFSRRLAAGRGCRLLLLLRDGLEASGGIAHAHLEFHANRPLPFHRCR